MNRSMIGAALTMFLAVGSLARAGGIGPVEPYAGKGDLFLGAAYAYGSSTLSHGGDDITIVQNQVFVETRYNRIGNVESCLRLGAADARTSDTAPDFRGSPAALVSGELRWLAWSNGTFGAGPFFQVTDALPAFKDRDQKIKDFTEILGGVCIQAKAGPVAVYAGPFAYYATAENEDAGARMNLRQKDALGGYGGVMVRLPWGLYAHVEGQYKGDAGVAADVTWVFATVPIVE